MILHIKESLCLDTPWGIGEEKYSKILQTLSNRKIERIIEFGSGISTIRLSKNFPGANIVSIESDDKFYRQTVELLLKHKVRNAVVLYCPLKTIKIGVRIYLTYNLHPHQLESDIDFALIDGPVESTTLRGREAPLYMIFALLKTGGVVALDDYHRKSAKAVVKNWLNSYRGNLQVDKKIRRPSIASKSG